MKYHLWVLTVALSICGFVQAQIRKPLAQKRLDAELLASDGQADTGFGASVAVGGDIVAVAAAENPGSVYLYSRLSKGTVTEVAKAQRFEWRRVVCSSGRRKRTVSGGRRAERNDRESSEARRGLCLRRTCAGLDGEYYGNSQVDRLGWWKDGS